MPSNSGSVRANSVVSGVAFNYLNAGFTTVTGFIYTAFIVHRLGHSGFGILVLATSFIAYSSLLDLGVGVTVMKMVAERAGGVVSDEIVTIARNAVTIFVAIGLVILMVTLGVEPFVGGLFHLAGAHLNTFREALLISALGISATFPSSLYTAIHQAYGDYRYLSILGICIQATSVGIGMILLTEGFGVIALVTATALLSVFAYVMKVRHCRVKFGIAVSRGKTNLFLARKMFSISFWIFLLNLEVTAIFNTDNIVAGAVLGTSAVAAYQVALGPASALQTAGDQFNMVSLTAAASLRSASASSELHRLLFEATRLVAAVVMPAVVVFALWGRQLLSLWVGRSFVPSYSTLVVLSLGMLVASLGGASGTIMIAFDRVRVVALVGLAEATANIVLSVLLARRIGIVGIAFGTTIPITLFTFVYYVPLACRLVGIKYHRLLRRLILPATVNAILYGSLRLLESKPPSFPNLPTLIAAAAGVFVVSLGACVLLDPLERATYVRMLRLPARRRL